ncbi:MAG: hypothetical protein ABIP75_10935 [Pyrinomonadaceae bacterium]
MTMKKEYDFCNGVRGKFFQPDAEFNLPIYLEPEIAEFVRKLAAERNMGRSQLVNLLLQKDKEIREL